jgi:hypothetical protein
MLHAKNVLVVIMVLSFACFVGTVRAEMVVNGTFGTGASYADPGTSTEAPWEFDGGTYSPGAPSGSYTHGLGYGYYPSDATNVVEELSQNGNPSWMRQTIGTVAANTTYTLSFDLQNDGPGDTVYNLGAGLFHYDTVAAAWSPIAPDVAGADHVPHATDSWARYSAAFTVSNPSYVGQDLGVIFRNWSRWADLDNISVVAVANPSPEPSTVVLLDTGLLGLLAYAWRKRKCVPS